MKKLNNILALEDSDIKLPNRSKVTNKGDCGKLLVVGGDRGMAGAPAFAAETAYRSGVGMVQLLTHDDNRIPLQILIPEAIVSFWNEWNAKSINGFSALTVGVGMGKSDSARLLLDRILSSSRIPTVLDADALNIISDTPGLFDLLGEHTVLTPHLMEFSRLTGISVAEIKSSPIEVATAFCKKYNTNLVLKDSVTHTVLSNGSVYVNTTGNSSLSKGGSGDILAGLIGSLLAQGLSMEKALPTAVYLHGKAGERAGAEFGLQGALARDVIKEIAYTIKDYS